MKEIAVPADPSHIRVFSYAAELAPSDIALSTLVRCLRRSSPSACTWDRKGTVGTPGGMAQHSKLRLLGKIVGHSPAWVRLSKRSECGWGRPSP